MRRLGAALALAALLVVGCTPIPRPGSWMTWKSGTPAFTQKLLLLPSGSVLALGPGSDGRLHLATVDPETRIRRRLQPSPRLWPKPAPPMLNTGWVSQLLPDGSLLVAGGGDGNPVASAAIYWPSRDAWASTAWMHEARSNAASAPLRDGRLLICGGEGSAGPLRSCEIYDPSAHSWLRAPAMSQPRIGAEAVTLQDGRVVVAGGTAFPGEFPLEDAEIFDSRRGTWRPLPRFADPVSTPGLLDLPDGRLLALGGAHGDIPSNDCQVYDPNTGSWSLRAAAPLISIGEALLLRDGRVAVFSGSEGALYDPGPDLWLPMTATPESFQVLAIAQLTDGRVLAVGGEPGLQFMPTESAIWDPGGFPTLAGSSGPLGTTQLLWLLLSFDAVLFVVLALRYLLAQRRLGALLT